MKNNSQAERALSLLAKMTSGGFKPAEWVIEAKDILQDKYSDWEKVKTEWRDTYHPAAVSLRDHSKHSKKKRNDR